MTRVIITAVVLRYCYDSGSTRLGVRQFNPVARFQTILGGRHSGAWVPLDGVDGVSARGSPTKTFCTAAATRGSGGPVCTVGDRRNRRGKMQ